MKCKEIRVFLASSEELQIDRMIFGDFIRQIDEIYEHRGIRVRLVKWEDLDASFQGCRSQEMYNQKLRKCQMVVALFHRKAGQFTVEEVNVAHEEYLKSGFPKVYAYMKDLSPEDTTSPELEEFKNYLFNNLGHYFCRYGNTDTLKLHFVMQLQLLEDSISSNIKIENSHVKVEGHPLVDLQKVPFAANNEAFRDLCERISSLATEITCFESILSTTPNEAIRQILDSKKAEILSLKQKRSDLENSLFSTARTIAELQLCCTSER